MKNILGIVSILLVVLSPLRSSAQEYMNMSEVKSKLAVRELRRSAVTGNIGWNSLTGVGISYNQFIGKKFEIDAGIGLASTGVKIGIRANYLFLDNNFTPLVSGGFLYGFGSNGQAVEYENINTGNTFTYTVSASPYAQLAFGIEYLSDKGFIIKALTGYAILTTTENYQIVSGYPTSEEYDAMDIVLGSGISMEVSIGYAFGK
jgi:hypothetical protein